MVWLDRSVWIYHSIFYTYCLNGTREPQLGTWSFYWRNINCLHRLDLLCGEAMSRGDEHKNPFEGLPHAWIQWKGTNVCMDIRCSCGKLSHLDCDFTYEIQCPHCKRFYAPNPHIRLEPLLEEELESDYVKVAQP